MCVVWLSYSHPRLLSNVKGLFLGVSLSSVRDMFFGTHLVGLIIIINCFFMAFYCYLPEDTKL